jgi:hypothetical protein
MKMSLDMMHVILIVLLVVNLVFVIKTYSKLSNKGKGCSCGGSGGCSCGGSGGCGCNGSGIRANKNN